MALNKTAQAALITELREAHNQEDSSFDSTWEDKDITLYRLRGVGSTGEQRTITALFEDPAQDLVFWRKLAYNEEFMVMGTHTKKDEANVFIEYTGAE
tara:strand:- start:331 stop:624 length:294 start_codon:yes stop_codon:yes gene_type:complete